MRTPLIIACMALVGCKADKRLWIESDPPGAEVRLDHQLVGVTPWSTEFTHYGTHRLNLRLDGYRTFERELEVPPPWYGRFPLDIFSEVLLPFGWSDHKQAHITLTAEPRQIDAETLEYARARAEAFRNAKDAPPSDLAPLNEHSDKPLIAVPR